MSDGDHTCGFGQKYNNAELHMVKEVCRLLNFYNRAGVTLQKQINAANRMGLEITVITGPRKAEISICDWVMPD